MFAHTPVLLNEVLVLLKPEANQNFVDATLGGAGYTKALLERTAPNGKVLAIDLDHKALENAQRKLPKGRVVLVHGNFREIAHHVTSHKFRDISGIVADIGLSSFQLDQSGRGISFQKDELLDMRFDESSKEPDARFILNNHSTAEIAAIFQDYGEEKYSHKIADRIVRSREQEPIKTTVQLNDVIKAALPKPVQHKWQDTARRIYQALRIAVNHELVNLERFLPEAFNILAPGGNLAVVTFHSLEDRIVKNYFKSLATGCICPPEFPVCRCGRTPQGEILTKKAIIASDQELEQNPRAKPAKLRAVKKL